MKVNPVNNKGPKTPTFTGRPYPVRNGRPYPYFKIEKPSTKAVTLSDEAFAIIMGHLNRPVPPTGTGTVLDIMA